MTPLELIETPETAGLIAHVIVAIVVGAETAAVTSEEIALVVSRPV
jgi:hypothetical protein